MDKHRLDTEPHTIEFFTLECVFFFVQIFVGLPPLNCWSKVKGTGPTLIYTMMHQHSL